MSGNSQRTMSHQSYFKTRELSTHPNPYVKIFMEEYEEWAYDEIKAVAFKNQWREKVFLHPQKTPLDVEIGTGNGWHFANFGTLNRDRLMVGLELKFKPLVQSIRRARKSELINLRMVRYNAAYIDDLFGTHEIDNVYIYFPDPWIKKKQAKHRLLNRDFFKKIWSLQKQGAFIEIKTDNFYYYDWILNEVPKNLYQITRQSNNWHQEFENKKVFMTQFESLFVRQGLPIHYLLLYRHGEL